MTKGRPATRGVDDAVVIGRRRGCVSKIVHGLESGCDFFIRTAACVVFVKTRCTDKIIASIKEIEHAYQDLIAELSRIPWAIGCSCEIWACGYYGNLLFFRLAGTGLEEIGRDGNVLSRAAGPSGAGKNPLPVPAGKVPSPPPARERVPG